MGSRWYNIQHPEIYQGERRSNKYFEGWYYKMVHQSGEQAFALIPGVSIESSKDRHAFIQLMDGTGGKSHYYEFPFYDFKTDCRQLKFCIGNNHFSKSKVNVDLPDIKVDIDISDLTPLQSGILNPGIMGWYSFTPFMQCYHGIVSMHHHLNGTVVHEGLTRKYQNAVGYIEKDWGTSFPKCWFWTHCNTFQSEEKISVFASVAHIPWMGNYFIGHIAAIQIGDSMYRFATYNGAKFTARLDEDSLFLEFKRDDQLLKIKSTKGIDAELKSPISGKMTGKVNESLQAIMDIEFIEKGKTLFFASGNNAGLEVAGEIDILLKKKF